MVVLCALVVVQAVAEVDILALVTRELPHVPELMGARRFYVEGNKVWVMFTLCRGGDLFQRVVSRGRLPEPEAAVLVERVLRAVDALHGKGVVHLDVKPENMLFTTDSRQVGQEGMKQHGARDRKK